MTDAPAAVPPHPRAAPIIIGHQNRKEKAPPYSEHPSPEKKNSRALIIDHKQDWWAGNAF